MRKEVIRRLAEKRTSESWRGNHSKGRSPSYGTSSNTDLTNQAKVLCRFHGATVVKRRFVWRTFCPWVDGDTEGDSVRDRFGRIRKWRLSRMDWFGQITLFLRGKER